MLSGCRFTHTQIDKIGLGLNQNTQQGHDVLYFNTKMKAD
jgi:hypothetical protein